MSKVKTFHGLAFIPVAWREPLRIGFHGQGYIIIQAYSRADAEGLLEDRGVRYARDLMKDVRLDRDGYWDLLRALRAADIVPADAVGVWAIKNAVDGAPVIEVRPDGTIVTVATLQHERGVGLVANPA